MPIFKKTKCRMKWCYSPLRHEDGTCDKICTYNTIHVQTNADRIRSMSDEELARFFTTNEEYDSFECPVPKACSYYDKCSECFLEWLKKEVDG